jgi:hypothetical protein
MHVIGCRAAGSTRERKTRLLQLGRRSEPRGEHDTRKMAAYKARRTLDLDDKFFPIQGDELPNRGEIPPCNTYFSQPIIEKSKGD